jgi:acetyl/propionyl-CoA carboxylase alpha subunit
VDAVLHSPRFTDTPGDPFATDGWRVAGEPARTLVALETPDGRRELRVDVPGGRVDDVVVSEHVLADHAAVLSLDGHRETTYVDATAHKVEVAHRGQRYSFERPDAFADHGPATGDGTLVAPMPGTVLDVHVAVGQQVAAGETLGAMEAMKMELALTAPFAGTVTEVNVAAGDQVPLGAVLLVVEADDA